MLTFFNLFPKLTEDTGDNFIQKPFFIKLAILINNYKNILQNVTSFLMSGNYIFDIYFIYM